ncbi:MAG: Coq4 family protein [Myxococcota bacterium]|nr:Coq4 family protein [Myxococcota bacterium]
MANNPLTTLRLLRAIVRLARDPRRLDEVFHIADSMESSELAASVEAEFRKDPAHLDALASRPRLGRVVIGTLAQLPSATLGRAFADFLIENELDPEDIQVNEVKSDFDYVRAHLRETHDIWHVATGFPTDVAGELGLQAFYLAQFRAPLAAMLLAIGMVNTLFFAMDDRDARMRSIVRGWLLGKRARSLFGYRWAERFDRPLADVRRELGLDVDGVDEAIDALIGPEQVREALRAAA